MLEKMQELIADQLSVDADSITEASSFKDDLGADSLDLYELIMALEEEYDVEIPTDDLESINIHTPLSLLVLTIPQVQSIRQAPQTLIQGS